MFNNFFQYSVYIHLYMYISVYMFVGSMEVEATNNGGIQRGRRDASRLFPFLWRFIDHAFALPGNSTMGNFLVMVIDSEMGS